jgi:uncharacterized OB-fold protein
MNGVALVLGLLVAGAVIVFLAWPWRAPPSSDSQGETVDDRYEAVLTALRDLDFDQALGKVAAEDYGPLRQDLLTEAAGLVAQRDEEAEAGFETPAGGEGACPACGRIALPDDEYCRGCGAELAPARPRCPRCGRMVVPGDLYCRDCGTGLTLTRLECPQCGQTVVAGDLYCRDCGAELALVLPPRRLDGRLEVAA